VSARVFILGTGFAGLSVARALRRRRADLDLVAVNRENYTLFTPMLPEVASGSIEPRHVAEPFRSAVPDAAFVLGEVEGVDFARRSVATRHPVTGETTAVAYDQLVIALGAISSTHGIAGAETHTFALKTLDDAIRLRDQLIR
jgi:NADH:ubiquinone reductase (H+-translocating)